jgi:tripeptide aminopeptidase
MLTLPQTLPPLFAGRKTAPDPAAQKKAAWQQAVQALPADLQPVVKTFGELVMQDSGAVQFFPRYPEQIEAVPRFPRPSHPSQEALARDLARRLQALGLQVTLDRHFNVIGTLPSNVPPSHPRAKGLPTVAIKAHLDTTYEQPNQNVLPRLHRRFNGQPIRLTDQAVLDPATSPTLKQYVGEDLITSDGTTLLGADAKAGVAAILEALRLIQASRQPHPTIKAVFTVDEESNLLGARTLDLNQLGADVALDLDDTQPGKINVRSYHGHNVEVTITARMVHTAEAASMGQANAMMLASRIAAALPKNQLMEHKRGQQMKGYLYLDQLEANWQKARMLFLVRDVDEAAVRRRVQTVLKAVENVQQSLGNAPAQIRWRVEEEYANPNLNSKSGFVQHLVRSARAEGLTPKISTFQGCTDAAVWSQRGLPTVILGCGWQNAHQLTEWVSAQDLQRTARHLVRLLTDWPERGPLRSELGTPPPPPGGYLPLGWPRVTTSPPPPRQ